MSAKIRIARIRHLHEFDLGHHAPQERLFGVDEAGRGCLAGPVVIAVVALNYANCWLDVNDSKQYRPRARHERFLLIVQKALLVRVGVANSKVIDNINILRATEKAMCETLVPIVHQVKTILTDAMPLARSSFASKVISVIKGDQKSACIAAASIVAKVYRDRIMQSYHTLYPQYGFDRHKGYGTSLHLNALRKYGHCPIHRLSFAPVKEWTVSDEYEQRQ